MREQRNTGMSDTRRREPYRWPLTRLRHHALSLPLLAVMVWREFPGLEDLARQRLSLSQTDAAEYAHLSPWSGRRLFGRGTGKSPCHVDQDVARSRVCAQTFDDIQPRALCIPPPKSFAHSPRTLHPAMLPRGSRCGQHLSRPEYTSRPIVTFAPQHTALRVRDLQRNQPPRSPAATEAGTRRVIWFKCYSKATDSDCTRSYNRASRAWERGAVGVIS